MGKLKRLAKKRQKIESKKEAKKKLDNKTNPFEIQVNKQKHKILGRRPTKGEVGKPLKSRYMAVEKRKVTLLSEYRNKYKTGKGLVDRRVKDSQGGIAARKAKLYGDIQLNQIEEDPLTHEGENIESISQKKLRRDHFNDDDGIDLLRHAEYVESAHFGGGRSGQPISSKEYLEEIAQAKLRRQLERNENCQLTEKLDEDWSAVRNLIKHKGTGNEEKGIAGNEDYDLYLNQLIFGEDSRKLETDKNVKSKEENQAKSVSINVQVVEKLITLVKSKDAKEISNSFQFLIDCNIEKFNSSVVDHLFKFLKSGVVKRLSLRSFCLLTFALSFKELQSFVVLRLMDYLRNLNYKSISNMVKRVFICSVINQLIPYKFFPEIVISLQNLLVILSNHPPFKTSFVPSFAFEKSTNNTFLDVEDCQKETIGDISLLDTFDGDLDRKENVNRILVMKTLILLQSIIEGYKRFDTFEAIFIKFSPVLKKLQENLPHMTSEIVDSLLTTLNETKSFQALSFQRKRLQMITMLEPRIEPLRKNRDSRQILQKTYKREYKGAQRELRKDSTFIRDTVLKETLESDRKRKDKVKKLMAEIAEERSMFKKKR